MPGFRFSGILYCGMWIKKASKSVLSYLACAFGMVDSPLHFLQVYDICRGFLKWGYPNSWMVYFIEGSLEVKLPTIWTDGKAKVGRVKEEKKRSEKIREEKEREERRCKCAKRYESRDSLCFFPMMCGSGGSKSRLAKAAGAEPAEQLHAVVVRSKFPSQNVQSRPTPDHFWKLRCRKSAHRCGAKQISKSKCTKHNNVKPLLEVEMSKKCTPLWCETHFQVKSAKKNWGAWTTFGRSDVEKVRTY